MSNIKIRMLRQAGQMLDDRYQTMGVYQFWASSRSRHSLGCQLPCDTRWSETSTRCSTRIPLEPIRHSACWALHGVLACFLKNDLTASATLIANLSRVLGDLVFFQSLEAICFVYDGYPGHSMRMEIVSPDMSKMSSSCAWRWVACRCSNCCKGMPVPSATLKTTGIPPPVVK